MENIICLAPCKLTSFSYNHPFLHYFVVLLGGWLAWRKFWCQLSDENPVSDFLQVIYHTLIVQPTSITPQIPKTRWCFHSTLFLTPEWGELLVGKKCVAPAFAIFIARSEFELFQLCHSHYIMGIRSCELSEPLLVRRRPQGSESNLTHPNITNSHKTKAQ